MLFRLSIAIFALLLPLTTQGAEEDVVVLTDSDFESRIKTYSILLVEFYAPW